MAHGGPLLNSNNPVPSTGVFGRFRGPWRRSVLSSSNPPQTSQTLPVICLILLVIALAASNGYVGWLFWDARQRYLALLRRTFSLGQPAPEA